MDNERSFARRGVAISAEFARAARVHGLHRRGPMCPLPETSDASERFIDLGAERRIALGEVIGCGSATVVHKGVLERFGERRAVAVKIWDGSVTQRLAKAIELSMCVVHESVVATYDWVVREDAPAILVAQLVEGTTLEKRLDAKGEPVSLETALGVGVAVADALAVAWFGAHPDGKPLRLAHGGVCARDVFLGPRGVKLADFGQSSPHAEVSGVRAIDPRSPRFASLAPEIACGGAPDARSDVFSLGVMLSEMILGPRFAADATIADVVRDVRAGVVRDHPFRRREVARPLVDVLQTAIAADPARRFPDARAFGRELARVAKLIV